MDNIHIEATDRSPEIDFNFQTNVFSMKGESFPENVPAFFGPHISALENHLENMDSGSVEFNFELIYFNSTTAKIIMQFFEILETTAGNDIDVVINWYYDADDDNMEELGEDFCEDLEAAKYNLIALDT